MAIAATMKDRILSSKANNPTWGARRIARQIKEDVGADVEPVPWRTVARVIKREWAPLGEAGRAQYRFVFWPESFERGDLPWVAAKAVADLLGQVFSFGEERPSVQLALCYSHIAEISDDLPLYDCLQLARLLVTLERLGKGEEAKRHVERLLACTPWHSEEDRKEYLDSIRQDPIPSTVLGRIGLGGGVRLEYAGLKPGDEEDVQLLTDASGKGRSELGGSGIIEILIQGIGASEASLEEDNGQETRQQ